MKSNKIFSQGYFVIIKITKKMTIITPTESNNNHLNLKYIIYNNHFIYVSYLKLEIIPFIELPQ